MKMYLEIFTLGKLSCEQTPSLRRRSRISQANIDGFSAFISEIFATTSNSNNYIKEENIKRKKV